MTKMFFGGLPTGVDVRKLMEAYGVPQEGAEIAHDEVAALLRLNAKSSRYRTVTSAWRKQLLRDHNVDVGAVPGVGFVALTHEERVAACMSGLQSGSRKVLRSIKRSDRVATTDPVLVQKQDVMRRFGAALAREATDLAKQIEPPKPSAQITRAAPKGAH